MTEPTQIAAGKFALYQTLKGGMHLTLLVDGETEPRHVEVPALMVKMMMRKNGAMVPSDVSIPSFSIDSQVKGSGE